ncbi:hypothetical protein A9Q77_03525 [Marinomonas sp. 42_23_T18]|nr:hypothetical protein A9Q77_03525 [Marinomonas sp. 42_23_T18]
MIQPFILVILLFFSISWVQAEPVVVSYLHGTPNSFLGKELLKRIYEKAGIEVRFEKYTSALSLRLSSKGQIDGETHRIFSLANAFPTLIRVPTAFSYVAPTAFVNTQSGIDFKVKGWASLKPYRVGAVQGMRFAELGLKGRMETVENVTSSDQLLRMLGSSRIDIAVTGQINGLYHINVLGLSNIRALTPAIEKDALYHYLHIKHQALVPLLDLTIKEMIASGELKRLRETLSKLIYDAGIMINAPENQ